MTNLVLKTAFAGIAMLGMTLPAASAMAADTSAPAVSEYVVASGGDSLIRSGAKAFKRGNAERAVTLTRAALKGNLSSKRAAIAQSNLCAAYASLGDMESAKTACDTALELRPDYEPAQNNKAALTYQLAQK